MPVAGTASDAARVIGTVQGYASAAVVAAQYLTEAVMAHRAVLGGVQAAADVAGSGAGTTVLDVLVNGTSVWPNDAGDRPTLAAASVGAFAVGSGPKVRALNTGDVLAIQVVSVSTTGHGRVKVTVALERPSGPFRQSV